MRLTRATMLFVLLAPVAEVRAQAPEPLSNPQGVSARPSETPLMEQPVEEQRKAQQWTGSAGLNEAYESDGPFAGTAGNGHWSRRVEAALGHTFLMRRGGV